MGGKKQQAQRTKNNAKPSSSGRSAELFGTGGVTSNQFSGFKSTDSFSTPKLFTATDIIDPNLDPNFQIVFKKMTKKDATTRYKALQEFIILCKESEDQLVNDALPVWVRLYVNLVVDVEHRIREAAQHAHRAIVGRVGRNIAPYIKQIAPLWFISQYDTHAPAASAASLAFKEAFPPHKIIDVISFCQGEILQYITDNLLAFCPLNNIPKSETKQLEELEAKYERIIVSSLNGYALYLSKIPSDRLDAVRDLNHNIISSVSFWKFSKYKTGAVRAAFFSLISTMCQHALFLLEGEQKRCINAALLHINDYDPVVLPNAWEATLHIVTNFPDSWQHVSVDKFFLPKLVNILSHGGQGNAGFIFPNVLLLLSKIPESVIKDKKVFFTKIFVNFREGFKQQSVYQSQSESEAVATSFNECLRYIIMQHIDNLELCVDLAEHSWKAIETIMTDAIHRHLVAPFFNSLIQTVLYWQKNEKTQPNYNGIIHLFWNKLKAICLDSINNFVQDKAVLSYIYDCQVNLIKIFNQPGSKKKKRLKVQFATDVDATPEKSQEQTEPVITHIDHQDIKIHLAELIESLSKHYFDNGIIHESVEIKLLTINQLWNLSKVLQKDQIESFVKGANKGLDKIISDWLADEQIPANSLVGFVFNTIEYCQSDKMKNKMLSDLVMNRTKEVIQEALKISIYEAPNSELTKWLISSPVRIEICNILRNATSPSDISSPILNNCLITDKNGEFVLGNDTVSTILATLAELLQDRKIPIENANVILNPLFTTRFNQNLKKFSIEILKLLELMFQTILLGKHFYDANIWQNGVVTFINFYSISDPILAQHIVNCASFIAEYLNNPMNNEDIDVNSAVKASFMLLNAIVQGEEDKMEELGLFVCKKFLSTIKSKCTDKWKDDIEHICLEVEFINGILPYTNQNIENEFEIDKNQKWNPLANVNFLPYMLSFVYSLKYMTILMDAQYSEEVNNDDEQVFEHLHLQLKNENYGEFIEYLLDMCHNLLISRIMMKNFVNTSQCYAAHSFVETVEPGLKELIQRLNESQQKMLLDLCLKRCNKDKNLWPETLKMILNQFLETSNTIETIDFEKLEPALELDVLFTIRTNMRTDEKSQLAIDKAVSLIIETYPWDETFSKNSDCINGTDYCLASEIAWVFDCLLMFSDSKIKEHVKVTDFVMVTLASWIQYISITKKSKFNKEFTRFVKSVCDLHKSFLVYITSEKVSTECQDEWQQVFANDSYLCFGEAWKSLADKTLYSNIDFVSLKRLNILSETICYICDSEKMRISCEKLWTDDENVNKWFDFGANCITSPYLAVQTTSYHILSNIVPSLVKKDSSCDERSLDKLSCQNLLAKLTETNNMVTALLQDYGMAVNCTIPPHSESFTYTFGYMLLWSLLLKLCQKGDSQTRYVYTLWIKEQELIPRFMESIVRLMPETVSHLVNLHLNKKQELFSTPPDLSFERWTSEALSNYSCWLYCDLLRTLPAVVRQWGAEAEPKFLSYLDKLTTIYVSPLLCLEEMKAVKEQQKAFENMKVQTFPSAREVVATYTVEESSMELVIKLANNHPLSPPKVEIPKGMSSTNQSKLIMQLSIFLTHQNGSIWDGLMLWKSNLDKKFDGIEECYICFSILHNSTQQLPKLSCQTCKKKFHSFCLYKWFTTSNKSTCPICRNHF